MKRFLLLVVTAVLLTACSGEPETIVQTVEVTRLVTEQVEVTAVVEQEVTRIIEVPVEVTRLVEPSPWPTYTPYPTPEPEIVMVTPTRASDPAVFTEFSGSGEDVGDNEEWPACDKAVFVWETAGNGNFIVRLGKIVDGSMLEPLLLLDKGAPDSGETLQPLSGGTYFFVVEGRSSDWRITGECRD